MQEIIKINLSYLKNSESFFYESKISSKIKFYLQKEKLITITWLYNINKTSYFNLILNNPKNELFYFNKNLDFKNKIKNKTNLVELIKEYTLTIKKPEIIILENCSQIKDIKIFIKTFYSKWYKIIIIDNNISIPSKPEIEIFNPKYTILKQKLTNNFSINNYLLFWDNENTVLINNKNIKINILKSQKDEILINDLIKIYSIKNSFLLNQTLTYLSFLNNSTTLRELHRNINENIKISLVTLLDYIDFLLNSKIIKRCYNYDFKKQKTIKTKAKYYFSDLWIRNSINYFSTKKTEAIENLIYNELLKNWYKIKSAINWKFNFDFYARKKEFQKEKNNIKINKIYIHISKTSNKQELKKEINKLNKVPYFPTVSKSKENIDETISRYLIVDSINDLGIKKLQYEEVKIVELKEFLMIK